MDSAAAVGIDVDRVIASTFGIGSLVAGIGGILFGLKYFIYPYMGFLPGLKAFAAAVVGGIGNIYGAMIGGIIIGMAEQVGPLGFDAVGINGTPYQDAIAFIILIVFLIIKPSGIMGKEHLVMSRGK
jgi:branched-chain amino acid transport system permease protein